MELLAGTRLTGTAWLRTPQKGLVAARHKHWEEAEDKSSYKEAVVTIYGTNSFVNRDRDGPRHSIHSVPPSRANLPLPHHIRGRLLLLRCAVRTTRSAGLLGYDMACAVPTLSSLIP